MTDIDYNTLAPFCTKNTSKNLLVKFTGKMFVSPPFLHFQVYGGVEMGKTSKTWLAWNNLGL